MAGSGRKPALKVAIGGAAVAVTTSLIGVAATQPASISTPLVDLAALIVVGSSTNPSGAGVEDFFGGRFNQPMYTGGNDPVYVNFWEGPAGIQAALENNVDEDRNVVLSSGWGAANASLLLLARDPRFRDNTIFVLDNDVARPDGGFGTRYPWFALIGVNPIPTPSDTGGITVVNTGYEYDYNSNAPGYVLNPFAAVNSLAAYLNTRLNQADIDLPVDQNGQPVDCGANTCAVTENDGVIPCPDARCSSPSRITAYVTKRNDTTYVTYTTRELPLTTLIRSFLGDYIANVTAPLLKWAVDSGYYGGNPIPSDPSAYRPARFIPSIGDFVTALIKLPGAILETLAAIVAPFVPRQAAPPATPMMTTELQSNEQRTEQEPQELTRTVSNGQETTGQTADELKTQQLTTEQANNTKFTTEEQKTQVQKTPETSTPLMNVVRNSLQAVPGQPFAPSGDNSTTTDSESVDSEQNSAPQQLTGPATIGDDVTNADPNPGGEDGDPSQSDTDAAA
jgi:hypothetical protein